jgi:hypothetical protein
MNLPELRSEVRLLLAALDDPTTDAGEALLVIRSIAHRLKATVEERSEVDSLRDLLRKAP